VLGAWAGERLLGGVLLFHHDRESAVVEIGIWVVAPAQGRGLAGAACRELIAFARTELEAERVEWRAVTENVASLRLAARLRFRHEATLRGAYVLRDRRHDIEILSLVGSELDRA
jgi:ribosomal-protein-serine acetyltransferase